jgi:hypothetical protein
MNATVTVDTFAWQALVSPAKQEHVPGGWQPFARTWPPSKVPVGALIAAKPSREPPGMGKPTAAAVSF